MRSVAVVRAWERFWFEREIEAGRLAALRVLFFGLLGVDQLYLMVEKGYRYGTANFNVAHFDVLDRILPSPQASVHTAIYLICGFLALRIAAGIAVRTSLAVLTPLYSYAYFSSMNDGYQHHYLMCWLLLISCAIPFHRTSGVDYVPDPDTSPRRFRSWGVQLLYAQVAIVYLFTATTKATGQWLDGWALERQIGTPWLRDWLAAAERGLGLGEHGIYAVIAHAVLLWQIVVAAAFLIPRLRPFACVTGPLFHIMVEVIGLEIRWFSYYMIALYYLMLFPESWYAFFARGVARALRPAATGWRWLVQARPIHADTRLGIVVLGAIACAGFSFAGVLPGTIGVAVVLAIAVVTADYLSAADHQGSRTFVRVGFQIALALAVFAIPHYTSVGYHYYRQKGGDLTMRGQIPAAIEAYKQAIELRPGPDSRHEKLARLQLQLGRYDEALENYRHARRFAPTNPRIMRGLANTLRAMGRPEEAGALLRQLPARE